MSRRNRVHYDIDLNMIGLFRIEKRAGGWGISDWEEERFIGNWESIEDCLDYCLEPDRWGYIQSNRTLAHQIDEIVLGYKLKLLIANTPFSEDICEFRSQDELRNHYYELVGGLLQSGRLV